MKVDSGLDSRQSKRNVQRVKNSEYLHVSI